MYQAGHVLSLSINRPKLNLSWEQQILYRAVFYIPSRGSSPATSVNSDARIHHNMSLSWFGSIEEPPHLSDIRIPSRNIQRYPSNSHTLCRRLGFSRTVWSRSVSSAVRHHVGNITSSRDGWGCCALLSMARGILRIHRGPGYCLVWNIPAHTRSSVQKS